MIQSVSKDLNYNLSTSSVSANTALPQSDSAADVKAESQVPKTDTVEISQQAREAMQQSKVAASNTDRSVQTDSSSQQKAAVSAQTAAQQKSQSSAAVVSSSDSSSKNSQSVVLTNLTESEMNKLVSQGVITKNQEQQELARRAAAKEQPSAENDAKAQISNAQQQGITSYQLQARGGAVTESESLLNEIA